MKVRVRFPDDAEADKQLCGGSSEVELSTEHVEVSPFFWSDNASPNVLYLETLDSEGNILQRIMIRARGSDGKIRVIDRSQSVVPRCDKPEEESPAAKEAAIAAKKESAQGQVRVPKVQE